MISFILGLIFLLISPIGFLAFVAGIALFLLGPMFPRVTNRFHAINKLHMWLGAVTVGRIGFVVTEHDDILLKQLIPDDIGTEKIKFNDDVKEFEDPHQARSSWLGIPFALADEAHGVLFDPIDAALGRRKKRLEEQNEMVAKATAHERDMYDVQGWVNGVLKFPAGVYELVDLSDMRQLITGSERAEHPHRIKEYYRKSQNPYDDTSITGQFLWLLVAIMGPFVGFWLLSTQLGTGGAGGSTIGFGVLVLLAGVGGRETAKTVVVALLALLPFVGGFVLLTTIASPLYALMVFTILGAGFWFVPILSQILRMSAKGSEMIAPLMFKLGLLGYDTPVWELTPTGYKLREYKNLEDVDEENISWHRFMGRQAGFTFTPYRDVWGTAVVDSGELEQRSVDKGNTSNVPTGYSLVPDVKRAVYGIFVPKSFDPGNYYVATDIAFGRFANAARGEKSDRRLAKSKEEFGGGVGGLSDRSMVMAMSVCGGFSLLLSVMVFFVL